MKTALLMLFTFAAVLFPVSAQELCPCVPVSHQWIVTPCSTWNCAAAQMVDGNGDPFLFAMPTGGVDYSWVVVRRVASGSAATDPNAPFVLESFDGMTAASARFAAINADTRPMLVTAPDGKVLVISRNATAPRPRAAGH
jgi:hypothetical protein